MHPERALGEDPEEVCPPGPPQPKGCIPKPSSRDRIRPRPAEQIRRKGKKDQTLKGTFLAMDSEAQNAVGVIMLVLIVGYVGWALLIAA